MGMGMGMDPVMLEVMLPEDGFIPDPIPVPIPVDIDMANWRADGCNVPVLSISDRHDRENALFSPL
jgi:hypothetical protein